MGSTTAEMIVHALDDFCLCGLVFLQQKTVCVHNHPRGTKAALQGVVVHEGFLERVEFSIPCQPLNGGYFLSFDPLHRDLTGAGWFVVDENGAGSADTLSATIFRSSEPKIGA
jgi:hypothetical protein